MINKSNLKFYIIPAGFLLLVLLIILSIPIGNKKTSEQTTLPTPTSLPKGIKPSRFPISTNGPTPTLIPIHFTGADLSQDIPPEVKLFGQQKMELLGKVPLKLSFGTISFNYKNDRFIVTLNEPKNQSQTAFNTWLKQTYPAIPAEQFAIQ